MTERKTKKRFCKGNKMKQGSFVKFEVLNKNVIRTEDPHN